MLSQFFVDRPVFAWAVAVVIMLAGVLAMRGLPVSQYPDIAPPSVMVMATYPGASAKVVESSVTQVLEQALKGLDGLLYFNASSDSAGASEIMLTFRQGVDPDMAQVQVQNKVNQAANRLPQPVQQQGLTVAKMQNSFLMIVAVYDQSDRLSDTEISEWLVNTLQDPLSQVQGVGSVRMFGTGYAMRVWLDPHKLMNFGLMPGDVVSAIQAQNTEVSVGELGARPAADTQRLNATVTAMSRLQTADEFRNLILKARSGGSVVRLGDVARVELGSEDYRGTSRLNGHPSSGLAIMLAPGSNALSTANAVKARIDAMKPGFPAGIKYHYAEDTTRFVELSIKGVIKTLLEAVLLVVLVMYVFLQNWRATLIPAITVPVVLLGTLAVLSVAGFSINTLTLFAMVLAIGLLVDDAIVVVENVERIMHEEGVDARTATRQSMREITGALVGIALVLSAVFLPMAYFGGSVGVIYRQFSVTIVAAMGLSVIVALTLTPALCATLLKPVGAAKQNRFFAWFNRRFEAGQLSYGRRLQWLLARPVRICIIYALIGAATYWGYQRLPTAFVPEEDQGTVIMQLSLPAGATFPRTDAVVRAVEKHFLEKEKANIDGIFTLAGFGMGGSGQNSGMAFVSLKDWALRPGEENSAQAIADRASAALSDLRDADVYGFVVPPIEGLGQTNGFEFWLQDTAGRGREHLAAASGQLMESLAGEPRLTGVRDGGSNDMPQLHVEIDQHKAAVLGLDLGDVNRTLSTSWGGSYVNDFVHDGRLKKVFVQADAPYRASPEDIGDWFVRGQGGEMTPFSAFSSTRWEHGPSRLQRFNGVAATQLFGGSAHGVSSGDAMDIVERAAARNTDTLLEWSGLSYQDKLSRGQAPMLFAVSILFVLLCLAALYESWAVPCAVLLVIPLGILGAVLALTLRGLPNDIYFQVGLLTTIGLSAKNAILIIEFAENAVRNGAPALESVIAGARQRLRPILMTSLAFGAGVIPLVLAHGPGSGSQHAIGTGVLGGMISATALAIYFVPLFYVLLRGRKKGAVA
ncbi:Multidrug efflux pump subunit AcrB [Andreprevotia sp. IGB-42]|uniref:efflux RND transporter permease subunit n=1 Tax=Andreprevotia sp. IGB-42 TaxID=2497473 RepID=UPI00135AC31E|nr:efflux RND transporter permease subunit [Andreprevotia sp. IGB-42]KAF0812634.1 Multidrug efflux pump subunit AcrB [Andreprevotia sp. IGB-42]